LRAAREAAYPPGEFIGQESFMRAGEILRLARRAAIRPGVRVLDLCCGVGAPGRLITRRLGCRYLGLDASAAAVHVARARTGDLGCRFVVAAVPPLPAGQWDVVLMLETMLAFPDKAALLADVAAALPTGGRFAFTVEEGRPLTPAEQSLMPDADTVWLTPLPELVAQLHDAGLQVRAQDDYTRSHHAIAAALLDAFVADARSIAAAIGSDAFDGLVTAHALWSEWLRTGRVRKFGIVAEKVLV
jgi:SAM-dependent methyltransferase